MSRASTPFEMHLFGYGLAKFAGDKLGRNVLVEKMGYPSRAALIKKLVDAGVIPSINTLTNIQDGFDGIFPNVKQGHKAIDKIAEFTRYKAEIDPVLGSYSISQYADFLILLTKCLTEKDTLSEEDYAIIAGIIRHFSGHITILSTEVQNRPKIEKHDSESEAGKKENEKADRVHTEAQWLLIQLGKFAGCQSYIASNDKNQVFNGECLSSLCIRELPQCGLLPQALKSASLIDLIWVKESQIVCAFEVECTTSIFSGILRMADLAYSVPYNPSFQCYIVSPKARVEKVEEQLKRPTFSGNRMPVKMQYFTIEELKEKYRQYQSAGILEGSMQPLLMMQSFSHSP